ncbi:MAG: SPOR domain-containing protein [bacterium]|nr:SPOR domain-containing protein [bacterium]
MEDKKNKSEDSTKKKKFINIMLATFAVCIVVYTIIGALVVDNFSSLQQVEDINAIEEDDFKGEIDDRLRFIAMQEDEMGLAPDEQKENNDYFDENGTPNEPEEIAAFLENESGKKNKFEEYNEKYRKKQYKDADTNSDEPDDIPYNKDVAISPNNVTLKVVIGDFASKEAAQGELDAIKSQFSATPFIKAVNGRYTIQVGSFKTQTTADAFVSSLKQQGHSARIIEE